MALRLCPILCLFIFQAAWSSFGTDASLHGRLSPQPQRRAQRLGTARSRSQAGPVLLPADWEACAARRDGSDAAHPGGRFSLAGRAEPGACVQASPRTAQGAPGTYKGVPGAELASLHPGEGLTTAPLPGEIVDQDQASGTPSKCTRSLQPQTPTKPSYLKPAQLSEAYSRLKPLPATRTSHRR